MAQVGTVNRYTGTLDALAKIGRDESKIAMEKQAKADFTAGAIAVTQGKTLQDIDKEQPWYNKVFGPGATLRGAESQTAISTINQYFADEAAFLDTDEGRSIDPNEYRKRQTTSLKGMLTGSSRVDSMITSNVTPKLGALAETHMKAHRAYVNEQNVISVSNRILGEANTVQQLSSANGWSHDLTDEAKAVLGQSLSNPPPGMDASSWRKMLVQSVVVNYNQGSDVMHRAAKEMGLQFTPQEQLQIIQAQDAYNRDATGSLNLRAEMAWGKIAAGVDDGIIGPADLVQELAAYNGKFGDLKKAGSRALFRKAFGKQEERNQTSSDAQAWLTGNAGRLTGANGNIDQKRAQPALKAAYELIDSQYDLSTPEGKAGARRDRIEVWGANGSVQDNSLKSRMSYISTTGVLSDGKVDPKYVAMFNDWSSYADRNEVKALDLIQGDTAKAQVQTIYDLLQEQSVDSVESGVLMVESMRSRGVDPAYLASKDFNDSLDTAVEDLAASKWSWFGFQSSQDASENLPQISAYVRAKSKQLVSQGYPVKSATATAAKSFARTHDFVNGIPVANEGQPLAQRMALVNGSAQDAINFHMQAFGYEPGDFKIAGVSGDGQLILNIADPDNADYAEQYQPVSIKEIGNNWNVKAVLPAIEGEVANAAREAAQEHLQKRAALVRRREALGIRTGNDDASIDAELERNRQATAESRAAVVKIIEQSVGVFNTATKLSPIRLVNELLGE